METRIGLLFLGMLAIPLSSQAMELPDEENASKDTSRTGIHAEIHLGAGLVSGGRAGFRVRYRLLSIEVAFGNVLQNLVALSDEDRRLTLGVNWYPAIQNDLALSFLLITRVRPGLSYPKNYFDDLYFSMNVGNLPFREKGFGVFIRGGFTLGYTRQRHSTPQQFSFYGPNIDVGVFFALF